MEAVTHSYQPLDLDQVRSELPKQTKKITSDKELENEVSDILVVLKDLTTDWKKRTEALAKITSIAFLFDGVCAGESKININFYIREVNKLGNVLKIQIQDLRSMGAKAAGIAIQTLAQCLGNDFENLAIKLIQKDALVKVLHNGNKTLSDVGHNCVLAILNHVCVPKLIQILPVEMNGSKSPPVHSKMSQYLFVLVTLYPFDGVLDRSAQHIDTYIKQCVMAPNSEARQNGRKSFLIWQKLAPENAQTLFNQLDYSAQKAIIEEQDKFAEIDEILGDDPNVKRDVQPLVGGPAAKKNQSSNLGQSVNTNHSSNYSNSVGGFNQSIRNQAIEQSKYLESKGLTDSRQAQKKSQVRNVSSNSNNRKSHHSKGSRSGISNQNLNTSQQRQSFGMFSQDSSGIGSNKSYSKQGGALNMRKQNSTNDPPQHYGQQSSEIYQQQPENREFSKYSQVSEPDALYQNQNTAYAPAMTRYSQNNKYMNPFLNQGEMMPQEDDNDPNPIDFYNIHHNNQKPNQYAGGQQYIDEGQQDVGHGLRQVRSDDQEMDIEPAVIGQQPSKTNTTSMSPSNYFSYVKTQKAVRSHVWSQRAQGLEDFLRYLIEMQPAELMNQLKTEKEFQSLIDCVIEKLEGETVIKIIEISLDLLELLLSSLPECLFANITQVILCFLMQLSNRREVISDKANDLINLARETLGADFLLPHFVSILNTMTAENSQLKTKISALEVSNVLIKESESLQTSEDAPMQINAIIKMLGNIVKLHSTQIAVINPVIGAILSLRDKNYNQTFKAIQEEISHTQYTIMKQIFSTHEKTLYKQLIEYQGRQLKQIQLQQEEQLQPTEKYNKPYTNPYLLQNSKQKENAKPLGRQSGVQTHSRIDSVNRVNSRSRPVSNAQTRSMKPAVSSENPPKQNRVPYNNKYAEEQKLQQQPNQQPKQQQQPQVVGLDSYQPLQVINVNKQVVQSIGDPTSILLQNCQILKNNKNQDVAGIQQALKNVQGVIVPKIDMQQNVNEKKEALSQQKAKCNQLIVQNFEMLIESLFTAMMILQQNEVQSHGQSENSVKNSCIEIMTYVIKQNYKYGDEHELNPLDQYRDQLLLETLKAYSPNIAPQHQCITNQVAEDLLEQLVISSHSDFLSQTLEPMMRSEQPPKLQSLLRMIQNKLRHCNKLQDRQEQGIRQGPQYTPEEQQFLVENLIPLADVLAMLMGNANADVRKSVVFCMVEIQSIMNDDELFNETFLEKLNQSQQKLVDIYITRKKQISDQKSD